MIWNYFKIRKENARILAEQKRILAEQKIIFIKKEIKIIEDKCEKISIEYNKEDKERLDKMNSVCPSCKSTNVNDRIKRIEGGINGSINGFGSSSLFGGSSYLSGSINGKIDTNEVNKCNDCQHEWKKFKKTYISLEDVLNPHINRVYYTLIDSYEAKNCKFDPMDINEPYNSLEEKKTALIKKVRDNWYTKKTIEFWTGTKIEVFENIFKKYSDDYKYERYNKYFDKDLLLYFGFIE